MNEEDYSRQPTQQRGEVDKGSGGLSSALGSPADKQEISRSLSQDKISPVHRREEKKNNSDSPNTSYLETRNIAGEGIKSGQMPVDVDTHLSEDKIREIDVVKDRKEVAEIIRKNLPLMNKNKLMVQNVADCIIAYLTGMI